MNFKNIIQDIHAAQLETFCLLKDFRGNNSTSILSTKRRGLYWIWTTLSHDDIINIVDSNKKRHVPVGELANKRIGLNNLYTEKNNLGFSVIYNGIGGYKKTPANFGLRERINQELNCENENTGTLNLLNVNNQDGENIFNLDNCAVSFFDFDDEKNKKIIAQLNSDDPYNKCAKDLEMLWRLEYGTPILSRH